MDKILECMNSLNTNVTKTGAETAAAATAGSMAGASAN